MKEMLGAKLFLSRLEVGGTCRCNHGLLKSTEAMAAEEAHRHKTTSSLKEATFGDCWPGKGGAQLTTHEKAVPIMVK